MISVKFDDKQLFKDLSNIIKYGEGFMSGVSKAAKNFSENLSEETTKAFNNFIDSMARTDPRRYHHIYEWNGIGNPGSRLFDLSHTISTRNNIHFKVNFLQSRTIAPNADMPFYNKAQIMEDGTPLTIKAKNASVLTFDHDGQQIFTKKPIIVAHPGGPYVQGSMKSLTEMFFSQYFETVFMKTSGIVDYLSNPFAFNEGFRMAPHSGKSYGETMGYNWLSKAGKQ